MNKLLPLLLLIPIITACEKLEMVPNGEQDPHLDPLTHWSNVLKTHVNMKGEIDFHGVSRNPENLNAFINYISRISPDSNPSLFPTKKAKIAYYINSYNALSMYNIIESGIPKSLSGFRKILFFYFKRFSIGGKKISLYTYENKIRMHSEERIHFALNCMSIGCPRLPQTPFTADNLSNELSREAQRFFAEPRNLQVDHEKRVVRLSEILKFYKKDFLTKSPSLISYTNKYLNNKIPADYKVEFISYDWTVNGQNRNRR
jgi:hypothetical protein